MGPGTDEGLAVGAVLDCLVPGGNVAELASLMADFPVRPGPWASSEIQEGPRHWDPPELCRTASCPFDCCIPGRHLPPPPPLKTPPLWCCFPGSALLYLRHCNTDSPSPPGCPSAVRCGPGRLWLACRLALCQRHPCPPHRKGDDGRIWGGSRPWRRRPGLEGCSHVLLLRHCGVTLVHAAQAPGSSRAPAGPW